MLQNYQRNGVPTDKLLIVYISIIRSVLEYSSNTYHSQINQGQVNMLERVQKRCLRIMYGYNWPYTELLHMSGLDTLLVRRSNTFEKFTRKTLENQKYSHWFPLNNNKRWTRHSVAYKEEIAVTYRLYKSPIFAMRRLLNKKNHRTGPKRSARSLTVMSPWPPVYSKFRNALMLPPLSFENSTDST